MAPRPFRTSILARARFIEDLVLEQVARGVTLPILVFRWHAQCRRSTGAAAGFPGLGDHGELHN